MLPVGFACQTYPPNAQADFFMCMENAHLIMPLELQNDASGKCTIYATKSRLHGLSEEVSANCITLEDQVKNLWRLDNLDEGLPMSVEDRVGPSLWDSNTNREGDLYVLLIPWKPGCPKFPDNRHIALHRLHSLQFKLGKSGLLASYSENIDKLVS